MREQRSLAAELRAGDSVESRDSMAVDGNTSLGRANTASQAYTVAYDSAFTSPAAEMVPILPLSFSLARPSMYLPSLHSLTKGPNPKKGYAMSRGAKKVYLSSPHMGSV